MHLLTRRKPTALLSVIAGIFAFCTSAYVQGSERDRRFEDAPRSATARALDTQLEGDVRVALYATFGMAANEIQVTARDGFVFLYGEIHSEAARVRAAEVAARVAGVLAVDNQLRDGPSG